MKHSLAAHRAVPRTPLLIDAVFGDVHAQTRAKRSRARETIAWLAALGVHLCLFLLAQASETSLEAWSTHVAALIRRDLRESAPTTIEMPEPLAPTPRTEPAREPQPITPAPAIPPRARRAHARRPTPQPSAASARAGPVLTQSPDPATPVDLTAETFVVGTASAYAGGATAARATHDTAVNARAAAVGATSPTTTTPALAVSLTSDEWHCPWPQAALAQELYEQAVVVRAWVRSDGSVESASVVTDPGYGFGAAAVACAMRTRFNPARDAHGRSVRALSPPIRVRFTR